MWHVPANSTNWVGFTPNRFLYPSNPIYFATLLETVSSFLISIWLLCCWHSLSVLQLTVQMERCHNFTFRRWKTFLVREDTKSSHFQQPHFSTRDGPILPVKWLWIRCCFALHCINFFQNTTWFLCNSKNFLLSQFSKKTTTFVCF